MEYRQTTRLEVKSLHSCDPQSSSEDPNKQLLSYGPSRPEGTSFSLSNIISFTGHTNPSWQKSFLSKAIYSYLVCTFLQDYILVYIHVWFLMLLAHQGVDILTKLLSIGAQHWWWPNVYHVGQDSHTQTYISQTFFSDNYQSAKHQLTERPHPSYFRAGHSLVWLHMWTDICMSVYTAGARSTGCVIWHGSSLRQCIWSMRH